MSKLIGIKYVGKKQRPQPDTVAGTKLVWEDTEQVHFVPEATAARLLAHPDVWAAAGEKKAESKSKDADLADLLAPEAPKVPEPEQPPLVPLDTMDAHALALFAQREFGQKLAPNMKPENMRARIRNWMNGGRTA